MDEQQLGKKQEQLGSRLEDIWQKVSKGFEEGIKVGKEEIVRTARVGKIRLEIAALRNNKAEKLKLLGTKTYELLGKGELSTELVLPLYEEIKSLDYQIEKKETEAKAVLTEKSESKEMQTIYAPETIGERKPVKVPVNELKKSEKSVKKKTNKKKDVLSDIETEVS